MNLLYNEKTTIGRLAGYFSKYFPQLTKKKLYSRCLEMDGFSFRGSRLEL